MRQANEKLILDGAAGTYLESLNATLHPKLWSSGALLSLEGQDLIRHLHKAYIEAGADVITAVTYQASIPGLVDAGVSEIESAELITRAVVIAREEADNYNDLRKVLVAAGLGPYGAYLSNGEEYSGEYGCDNNSDKMREFWLPRVEAVLKGSPDILLFETTPNITELKVIVDEMAPIARDAGVPVWISLSLHIPPGDGEITLADGSSLTEIKELLKGERCHVQKIGANCFDVREVGRVIDSLGVLGLPLLLYPNSGEIYDGHEKVWRQAHQDHLSDENKDLPWDPAQWYARGVDVLGGCCRTSPETVRQIHQARVTAARF